MSELKTLILNDNEEMVIAMKAIGSKSRIALWQYLANNGEADISTMARFFGMTQAAVSSNIKLLGAAKLVKYEFQPGYHGVRKICYTDIGTITFHLLKQEE